MITYNNTTHPSGIPDAIVEKVVNRRGRLHAFETLDPTRTALIVVDMDSRSLEAPDNGRIRALAEQINQIAQALRDRGGTVVWVTTPIKKASANFIALYGEAFAKMHEGASGTGGPATTIWSGLHTTEEDVYVKKKGVSAFFPGNCDLHDHLQLRQIQSVLLVGMVTNVCCESTARDATELDYQVTMVSDAMWGHKEGQHEATLATFYRNFGDVRPTDDLLRLIKATKQ